MENSSSSGNTSSSNNNGDSSNNNANSGIVKDIEALEDQDDDDEEDTEDEEDEDNEAEAKQRAINNKAMRDASKTGNRCGPAPPPEREEDDPTPCK